MLKAFQTFMQVDGGGLLLPEMMLVLFAMGILLTDYSVSYTHLTLPTIYSV